eukprot:gnl/MRDRNA2_/MRDRNA2_72570_c0_seq1.p1 gnl/MRDRNA2_/MRDRNA2_72570_c0~~gnl/MRDRNA2_/MRDRNA2_72570_c0_seq1.p1  ORF type:complete len:114 (+),score=30.41 gnl/MRDRNA2_/MRDRNA2_72570_c0_seq1:63-404(+)
MDMSMKVLVEVKGADFIAELQLMLTSFVELRKKIHWQYEEIRAVLPSLGVKTQDQNKFVNILLEEVGKSGGKIHAETGRRQTVKIDAATKTWGTGTVSLESDKTKRRCTTIGT